MSNRSKGNKAEHEYELIEQSKGRITYRVKGSTMFNKNVDIFNIFDILSIDSKTKEKFWIQVKSNKKLYEPEKERLTGFKEKYFNESDKIVWANRKDYEGWEELII